MADKIKYSTFDREEDKNRITNAKRLMYAFSQRPYQIWKIIEEKIQPYLEKKKFAEKMYYNQLLEEIITEFSVEGFADNERLEGLYLLGFHSQAYDLRYKKKTVDNKKEEEQKND